MPMELFRRARWVVVLLGALPLGVAPAQDYPNQTVKIVVPFVAGGGVDVVARIVAPRLGEELGQSVIIENRSGAGGALGAGACRRLHAAHGHRQHARNELQRLCAAELRSGARFRSRRAAVVVAAAADRSA